MSVLATAPETRELLIHYGVRFDATQESGGFVVTIEGRTNESEQKTITILSGEHQIVGDCPISDDSAHEMIDAVVAARAFPKDTSLEHLVRHVIVRLSHMYTDSGIDAFRLESVHLHQSGYTVGSAKVWRTRPLHLRARQKSEKTQHESFPHLPNGRR